MTQELPYLDPDTFNALMERLKKDADLKNKVIKSVHDKGFVQTLEDFFQLSERQNKILADARSDRVESGMWNQFIALALTSGGQIRIVHEERESVDVELHANIPLLGHIDVSIHC